MCVCVSADVYTRVCVRVWLTILSPGLEGWFFQFALNNYL